MFTQSSKLTGHHFAEFVEGNLLGLVVKDFLPVEECKTLSARIKSSLAGTKSESKIYMTNSRPFYNVDLDSESSVRQYLQSAHDHKRFIQRMCSGINEPHLVVCEALENVSGCSVQVAKLHDELMLFPITRLWKEGAEALPHQDIIERESRALFTGKTIKLQFGVNLVLDVSLEGGNLRIWNQSIEDEEWDSAVNPGSYGFSESALGIPDVDYSPAIGDLTIVNTRMIHAVTKTRNGNRLTLSAFGILTSEDTIYLWA